MLGCGTGPDTLVVDLGFMLLPVCGSTSYKRGLPRFFPLGLEGVFDGTGVAVELIDSSPARLPPDSLANSDLLAPGVVSILESVINEFN